MDCLGGRITVQEMDPAWLRDARLRVESLRIEISVNGAPALAIERTPRTFVPLGANGSAVVTWSGADDFDRGPD